MAMSNREMIESALKRVNALLETNGKLQHDSRYGYYVINGKDERLFDDSAMSAKELLAYLHGLEDSARFLKAKGE